MLKLIQVGFALLDKDGNVPPTGDVWQFNFQFSLNDDMYSQDSVDLLRNAGIDFGRHQVSFQCDSEVNEINVWLIILIMIKKRF